MASVALSAACAAPVSLSAVSAVSDDSSDDLPIAHSHGHSHGHGHSHKPSPVASQDVSPEAAWTTYATVFETSVATVYETYIITVTPTITPVAESTFSPAAESTISSAAESTFSPVAESTFYTVASFTSESSAIFTAAPSSTFSTVYFSTTSTSAWSFTSEVASSFSTATSTIASSSTASSSTASSAASSATASSTASPSTSILLPLYIWPTDNTTWAPVYEAAAGHPDIEFKVIVNPDSGPGDTTYPEAAYIAGIAQLNSYDNVVVLGYIPTEYGTRSASDVESDISTYSGWSAYTAKNITVSGIFFDEAPRTDDTSLISYMTEVADNARSSNLDFIVFNPGTKLEEGAVNGYFDAADLIVEFENSYDAWIDAVPADEFSSTEDYSKDAVLLYSAPTDANYETVIKEAKDMGLGAAYLTNTVDYKSADTVLKVTAAMVSASD
ncbi:Spherulation-specific family 4 [Penicillium longicatenatum]|uniref:Spherulation-specific family 4 n=1 Tax=Penicillium longicatenatum TaxID=1561947 RepID=UPI002548A0E4|nr:Spherulation-specific family 4 [Penicillium longicatenatum]KAJ5650532.1 Spherulation-specific family 4 [Penicillium longicatenatum]